MQQSNSPLLRSDLFLRLLDYQEKEEKKVITVAIVSEREDSYRTIITPDGCLSPMESVPVDYNHNFISTGAWLKDIGVQDIDISLNGQIKKIKARVVEVHVPSTARMLKQNPDQTQPSIDEGSLYDAVKTGRVRWVSIYFDPVDIERDYDEKGNVKRETYKTWRLNYLSLLDKKAGQDDAFFLDMRSKNVDNNITNSIVDTKMKKTYKRAYLGDIVKRLSDGQLGLVSQVTMTEDKKLYSVKMFADGAVITTDSVAYREEIGEENEGTMFVYASMGEAIADMYTKLSQQKRESEVTETTEEKTEEPIEEKTEDAETIETEDVEKKDETVETPELENKEEVTESEDKEKVEKAKERSKQLLTRVKELKSMYREQLAINKKLRNSPMPNTKRTVSSAVDLEISDSEKTTRSLGEAIEDAKVAQKYS